MRSPTVARLVARWFCEGFRQEQTRCRVILVALRSPARASPRPRVKAAMDFLSNVGEVIGLARVSVAASSSPGEFARRRLCRVTGR